MSAPARVFGLGVSIVAAAAGLAITAVVALADRWAQLATVCGADDWQVNNSDDVHPWPVTRLYHGDGLWGCTVCDADDRHDDTPLWGSMYEGDE